MTQSIRLKAGEKRSGLVTINVSKASTAIEIFFEPEASATLLLNYCHEASADFQVIIKTHLAEKSHLNFIHHVDSQHQVSVIHEITQAKNSQLNMLELTLKSAHFQQSLNIHLQEERADCVVKGIYLGCQNEKIAQQILIHHEAAYCQSQQFFKGILDDQARALFAGKVIIAKDAKKSIARQKNDTILLSKQAEIQTKPELEIYHDDVVCSHGATVGELSEEALFYLTSRGVSMEAARKILLTAFVKEVVDKEFECVFPWIEQRVD